MTCVLPLHGREVVWTPGAHKCHGFALKGCLTAAYNSGADMTNILQGLKLAHCKSRVPMGSVPTGRAVASGRVTCLATTDLPNMYECRYKGKRAISGRAIYWSTRQVKLSLVADASTRQIVPMLPHQLDQGWMENTKSLDIIS